MAKYKVQLKVHGILQADSYESAIISANELKKKLADAIRAAGLTEELFWVGLDIVDEVKAK